MDSLAEEDPTLPIDFDQTGNFAHYLAQNQLMEKNDSIQSDVTLSEVFTQDQPNQNNENQDTSGNKVRSFSANDQPMERPSSRSGLMREQENIISDLKKECFGLKMRIYYMEERLHDIYDASTEDIIKTNIELKVTIEQFKQELEEKSALLTQASRAMEQITDQKSEQFKELVNLQIQEEVVKTKKFYEEKMAKMDQENTNSSSTVKEQANLVDDLNKKVKVMEKENKSIKESQINDEKALKSMILELEGIINKKEERIQALVKETKDVVGNKKNTLSQQDLLNDKEKEITAQKNLVVALKKQIGSQKISSETMSEQIAHNEKSIKGLRTNLHEKELEKQKILKLHEKQMKKYEEVKMSDFGKISALEDKVKSQQLILSKNNQLRDVHNSSKSSNVEVFELQMQLKNNQFEIEKLKLKIKEKDQDALLTDKKVVELQKLCDDNKKKREEEKEKLSHDFNEKISLKQLKIEELQELCHNLVNQQSDNSYKDHVIFDLSNAVDCKDRLIKNLVGSPMKESVQEKQENIINQLQDKLKEHEKKQTDTQTVFLNKIKSKDGVLNNLSKELHDKDALLKRLESKYALVREQYKNMELVNNDQRSTLSNLQSSLEDAAKKEKEIQSNSYDSMHQKDLMIEKLTNLLSMRDNEYKKFESYLNELLEKASKQNVINDVKKASDAILKKFEDHLNEKDELIKEIGTLKDETLSSHLLKYQEFLTLIKEKENDIKELQASLVNQQTESNGMLKDLNIQLVTTEQELKHLNGALMNLKKNRELETSAFQQSVKEKDETIQTLVKSGSSKDEIIGEMKGKIDQLNKEMKNESTHEKLTTGEDAKMRIQKLQQEKDENHTRSSLNEDKFRQLDKLIIQVEQEKGKYMGFLEKIQNNLHPDSLTKLIHQETDELKELRTFLQDLFESSVADNPSKSLAKLQNGFLENHFRLKESFNAICGEMKILKQENSDMQEWKREKVIDYDGLKQEMKQLELALKNEKEGNSALQKKINDTQDALTASQSTISRYVSSEKEALHEKEKMVSQLELNSNNLEEQLTCAELEIQELRTKFSLSIAEKNNLENKISANSLTASDEKKMLKKDVRELCNINERLRNKVKDLNKKLDAMKSERNNIYEKLQAGKVDLQVLTEQNELLTKEKASNENQLALFEQKEYLPLLYKFEQLESCSKELKKKVESNSKKNRIFKTDTERLQGAVKSLTDENLSLKTKIQEKDKVEKELVNCKQVILEKNLQFNILQNDLEHYQNKYDESHTEVKDLKRINDNLKTENESLSENHDNLKVQLHDALIDQKEFARLQFELESLRDRKISLESQLKELGDSAGGIKYKLSTTIEDNLIKDKEIHVLKCQIVKLEEQMESFSPMHTSSRHNIALSSEAFTQTQSASHDQPDGRNANDNNSLILAHIQEMRELRKQLEETIRNNDVLRKQLEDRLNKIECDAKQLNDPVLRVSLIRDNDAMRIKIAEQDKFIGRLNEEKDMMQKEQLSDKECIKKLEYQIHELNDLSNNLKLEMEVYDRLVQKLGIDKNKKMSTPGYNPQEDEGKLDKNLLIALLNEIRDLREQLQQSIDVNNALRVKLEEELGRPISISPFETPFVHKSQSMKRSLFTPSAIQHVTGYTKDFRGFSPDETPTKDYGATASSHNSSSVPSPSSVHSNDSTVLSTYISLCVKTTDYDLFKQLLQTCVRMVSAITTRRKQQQVNAQRKDKLKSNVQLEDLNELHKILKEMWNLMLLFQVQPGEVLENEKVEALNDKVNELKNLLSTKDDYIKSTLHLLMSKYTNHENIEQAIADKLLKAKETLKTTKGNLKNKAVKSKKQNTSDDSDLTTSFDTLLL